MARIVPPYVKKPDKKPPTTPPVSPPKPAPSTSASIKINSTIVKVK